MQPEVFFLNLQGEQRGPYTLQQVNHLEKCGLIKEDTTYWREGMEGPRPVAEILHPRRFKNRVALWSVCGALVLIAAIFTLLFGRVTLEAWNELTKSEFTAEAAWWRARGLVRQQLAKGEHIQFDALNLAAVTLHKEGATVAVAGTLTKVGGQKEHATWEVQLYYDPVQEDWKAQPTKPTPN